ncbi:GNAT family N-acetyltransferase [Chitinibacter sp. S2-10]|uniref:GNAT family N-acetyltransferase n=1 Tax=Chitinibacter sp. S2-10 TaxID=3373597 RepID=UPI0039777A15
MPSISISNRQKVFQQDTEAAGSTTRTTRRGNEAGELFAWHLRPILAADLAAILRIQAACYPAELLEDAATFQAKIDYAPDCNWLIEVDGDVQGYLFTHPWRGETPPALNRGDVAWPSDADCFYLHDLAIHPAARGLKLSTMLAGHALRWGEQQGFKLAMLVAVGNAPAFWRKLGFTPCTKQDKSLAQYGNAVLMQKIL